MRLNVLEQLRIASVLREGGREEVAENFSKNFRKCVENLWKIVENLWKSRGKVKEQLWSGC